MNDQSHLDRKYFIDETVYNCPFCNRNNVRFAVVDHFQFHWNSEKDCFGFITECLSCNGRAMHLSFEKMTNYSNGYYLTPRDEIDEFIFYSVPTSFFTLDHRIPKVLRELITEAEGCLKMNFITGASACMRKSIYELLIVEKCSGHNYDEKIKSLKEKYINTDGALFDILAQIKDMTSDKIHEQSWDKWDHGNLKLIIETLKSILYDIYVDPAIRTERSIKVQKLRQQVTEEKKNKSGT